MLPCCSAERTPTPFLTGKGLNLGIVIQWAAKELGEGSKLRSIFCRREEGERGRRCGDNR